MVVISIKSGQQDGFLYETSVQEQNEDLIAGLVNVWNMRIRINMLIGAIRDLAKYGPMKPKEDQGIDSIKEQYEAAAIEKSATYAADPSGVRTGNGPGPQLAETLERVCQDAEDALSPNLVKQRVAVSMEMLEDKLNNCRGAVMMAYPMGLPAWDPVALCLTGIDGLDGTQASAELLNPDDAQLWVASKEFPRGDKVGDRLGWNEKTKVVAKLQKPGSGPPAREPSVSEEERKAMMAHYFKRQEEMKNLAEATDDDYLTSSWADPKALQKSLRGQTSIKAPGLKL
jgi:hypothetical protein